MKKFIVALFACFLVFGSVRAQYDVQFTQNMNCLSFSNPAMISIDGQASVFGINRQQWAGSGATPKTTAFNVSLPFQIVNTKQAGGIMFFNDALGLFSYQSVYLQYAYFLKLGKQGTLGFGLNLGLMNHNFDGSKVSIPTTDIHTPSNDPAIPKAQENGIAFDAHFGVSYYDEKKYAGIALAHMTKPSIGIGENVKNTVNPMLNITAGYNFFIQDALYIIKPSVFLKTDFASWQLDINAILEYKQLIFGGFTYRIQDAVALMIGLKIAKFTACYSYDITTSKLIKAYGGTHEIMLGYKFNLGKTKKNKSKSVRIL
jgi:type IX secretion system PorP/SprF family membrane protein